MPQILQEFQTSNPALSPLLITIHVIGSAIGPLFLAPIGEMYGRNPLMHASNAMFLISSILSAICPNITLLLVARVIMGVAGCIPSTIGGGYIADLIPIEKRGRVIGIWAFGPVLVCSWSCQARTARSK